MPRQKEPARFLKFLDDLFKCNSSRTLIYQ